MKEDYTMISLKKSTKDRLRRLCKSNETTYNFMIIKMIDVYNHFEENGL